MLASSLRRLPSHVLEAIVERGERLVFAGLSTHRDVLELIDCERELMRRDRLQTARDRRDASRRRDAGATHGENGAPLRF